MTYWCKEYELSKNDHVQAKGIAILGMVMLHLFCKLDNLPYTPLLYISEVPLVYYLGLFGDLCVPVYCFLSGYAQYLLQEESRTKYLQRIPHRAFSLLLNYWIVIALFSVIGVVLGKRHILPGSATTFLGNLLLINQSYNGAWWFIVTYLILSVLSPLLFCCVNRSPWFLTFIVSGILYFVAYLFRFQWSFTLSNPVFNWLWQQALLVTTSQFSYTIGMLCRKHRVIAKLRTFVTLRKSSLSIFLYIIAWFFPLLMIILHAHFQSLIIAPITGLISLFCYLILIARSRKMRIVSRVFLFMGKHSTNIWLTHMFFCLSPWTIVFTAKYPALILLFLISLCLCVSYAISAILKLLSPK